MGNISKENSYNFHVMQCSVINVRLPKGPIIMGLLSADITILPYLTLQKVDIMAYDHEKVFSLIMMLSLQFLVIKIENGLLKMESSEYSRV